MNKKVIGGVAVTALSVAAAYYGSNLSASSSSSNDVPKDALLKLTNHSDIKSSNNSNGVIPGRTLADAFVSKLPGILPLPLAQWNYQWDGRQPKTDVGIVSGQTDKCSSPAPSNEVPTATRHLFLVRHGQYFTEKLLEHDRKLTELGREQLDLTGGRLRELGFCFDRMVASTMTRAQESASIVHKHFPELSIECEPLLEEGAPVKPEPPVENWAPTDAQFKEDGERIEEAFKKYFHRASPDMKKDSYEIVVCHGNVIRYCVCRALQIPPEAWLRMGLSHGSITWVSIKPSGRVSLNSLGVIGHMPPKKISSV